MRKLSYLADGQRYPKSNEPVAILADLAFFEDSTFRSIPMTLKKLWVVTWKIKLAFPQSRQFDQIWEDTHILPTYYKVIIIPAH